jgi:competence protein ComEA
MGDEAEVSRSLSAVEIWQYFKIPIVLGLISLLCVGLSITIYIKSYQSPDPIQFSSGDEGIKDSTPSAATMITVDIEGAVRKPGVYMLPRESRIEDAIEKAEGLANDADYKQIAQTINRAAKLVDGAKLFFPKLGESAQNESTSAISGAVSSLVNVNTASQSELEALSGIGPVTAKKIIDNRPYQILDELVSKKVLGQSTFDTLKDQLGI